MKYPVVLNAAYEFPYELGGQLIANTGIYMLPLHTASSGGHPIPPEDILELYHELLEYPQVDPNRIYVLCQDASARTVKELVENHPYLWAGDDSRRRWLFQKFCRRHKHFPQAGYCCNEDRHCR